MIELNNPASRFYKLLKQGQSEGRDKQGKDIPCEKVWNKLLDVSEGNAPLLLRRIGYVFDLPRQIEMEIRELDHVNHDIYLKWIPRVNAGVKMMNFHNPWKTFIDRFDAETLYGIEICADALSRSRPERTLSDETIKTLLERLKVLKDDFDSNDFSAAVAEFISERIDEIISAIEEYPYRGIAPIEAVLEGSIGKVVVNPEIYHESQSSAYGKRFWEFMGYLAISVTIVTGAIQIGKDIVTLLPSTTTEEAADVSGSDSTEEHEQSIKKQPDPSTIET